MRAAYESWRASAREAQAERELANLTRRRQEAAKRSRRQGWG